MGFDQLSYFPYFRADTDLIIWYFLKISTFSKVCNLRFLEKKAGSEVLEFLLKLLSSMPQLLVISISTHKYHMPSMDDVIDA